MNNYNISRAVLLAALLGTLSNSAMASNGVLAYANGIISHGLGGAGVANAAEAMSALDNPALAARVGAGWGAQITAFNLQRSADVGQGYVESNQEWFVVPGGGWVSQLNPTTVAGVTLSTLGGINVDYPAALFGVPVGIDLTAVVMAPTIASRVSDTVSVGAAFLYGYQTMQTKGPGLDGLPRNADDSASGWGLEFGVAIDLSDRTVLGLSYQSKIDFDLMPKLAAYQFAHATDPQITFPPITIIGISHQINSSWKVLADISMLEWSEVAVLEGLFGWQDQTVYKIGFEQQVNDQLAFRFGYNYGKSPIPADKVAQNVLTPALTEQHYTMGFSYQLAQGSLSGYFAVVPEKVQRQAGLGLPGIKSNQNAIGLAYHVEFR